MNKLARYLVEVAGFTFEYFVREPGKKQQGTDRSSHAEYKRKAEKLQ